MASPVDGDNDTIIIDPRDYEDLPEPLPRGPGGRPSDPRLKVLAIRCCKKDDPKKDNVFRCAGTTEGCTTAWKCKNRIKQRILVHASTCEHLPRELRQKLDGSLASKAPSAKVESHQVLDVAPTVPTAQSSSSKTPSQKSIPCQPSVIQMSRKARIQQLSTQLDADIVQLFCVGGLPPSKVDLPEWKTMWKHAVPDYVPASASTLEEYHIASEASFVRTKQLEHLRICNNLSITFDGQTIRLPQSVYTIHIITRCLCQTSMAFQSSADRRSQCSQVLARVPGP